MIAIPERDASASPHSLSEDLLHGLPKAFAILFYSADSRLGWALLAISLLAFDIGLSGLLGAIAAGVIAGSLGFERSGVRSGYLLFNPLLVCLALGLLQRSCHFPPGVFIVLWCGCVLGGLGVSIAMQNWIGTQFGLSAQSLPAVVGSYALHLAALSLASPFVPANDLAGAGGAVDPDFLPAFWLAFFRSFGAMIFQPAVLPGILVYLALALTSPLPALLASAAFAAGFATLSLLGLVNGPDSVVWCGFNFLLCGVALGSSYFAPSRMSLLLALAGAFLCALAALALAAALRPFGLGPSALPYNLVVLTLVYALRWRGSPAGLHTPPTPGMPPETASRFILLQTIRFPHLRLPALSLPFKGESVVTQGHDGPLTHRGLWRHALDFEVMPHGRRFLGSGASLDDFPTFNQPVLAPCAGVVFSVTSHVPENSPGSNNPEQNWGNFIVLHSDAGPYVLLAHLRQDSPLVHPGQRVLQGEMIARCGNSGRSPVPHLHLQIQDTPQPGAPTCSFCLKNYLETPAALGSSTRHRISGIPSKEVRVAAPTPLPALHSLFCDLLPGERRYLVHRDDLELPPREEAIVLDFDELGRFRLRSPRFRASLAAFISENSFYTTDYDGPGHSLLALLSIGLARVPCIADPGVFWEDSVASAPHHRGILRWLHDMAGPFFGPGILPYRYHLHAAEDGFQIHCRFDTSRATCSELSLPFFAPRQIITTLAPRHGVQRIEAILSDSTRLVAELLPSNFPISPPRFEKSPLNASSETILIN